MVTAYLEGYLWCWMCVCTYVHVVSLGADSSSAPGTLFSGPHIPSHPGYTNWGDLATGSKAQQCPPYLDWVGSWTLGLGG